MTADDIRKSQSVNWEKKSPYPKDEEVRCLMALSRISNGKDG
jgi:hypothetical protein